MNRSCIHLTPENLCVKVLDRETLYGERNATPVYGRFRRATARGRCPARGREPGSDSAGTADQVGVGVVAAVLDGDPMMQLDSAGPAALGTTPALRVEQPFPLLLVLCGSMLWARAAGRGIVRHASVHLARHGAADLDRPGAETERDHRAL